MDATRAGGEDLVVLGCHIFDLARLFAGDAHWCTAWIRQSGHDATLADVKGSAGGEGIGPILGDEINAQFGMDDGVLLSFTSRNAQLGTTGQLPCESELPHSLLVSVSPAVGSLLSMPSADSMELVGSEGVVRAALGFAPEWQMLRTVETAEGPMEQWLPIEGMPVPTVAEAETAQATANLRLAEDWVGAVRGGGEPLCSGANALAAMEMVHAVFAAGLRQERVAIPLAEREHPLRSTVVA